jgi:hypothetical protein
VNAGPTSAFSCQGRDLLIAEYSETAHDDGKDQEKDDRTSDAEFDRRRAASMMDGSRHNAPPNMSLEYQRIETS